MAVNDYGKLIFLTVALVGGFVLALTGQVTEGVGIIGTVLGYVTGNGRLAQKQALPSPMVASAAPVNLSPMHATALVKLAEAAAGAEQADRDDPYQR